MTKLPSKLNLLRDVLIQTWMIHYIQIIGEAANKLSTTIQEKYTEVKRYHVVGMRNLIIH
ncbi:MAG: HepT-like ribonuclease domain-containing protein [Bacteroidota bacterium]